MDLLFVIAFFACLAGSLIYTIVTHYSTSRVTDGSVLVIALIVSVVLLGLGIYAILDQSQAAETRMWALGTCGVIGGFWLKNPTRDFHSA